MLIYGIAVAVIFIKPKKKQTSILSKAASSSGKVINCFKDITYSSDNLLIDANKNVLKCDNMSKILKFFKDETCYQVFNKLKQINVLREMHRSQKYLKY